jgi:hypothetical protein
MCTNDTITRCFNLLLKIMIKLASTAAIVLLVCTTPSLAWWDNWTDDFFGDGFGAGDFDFGFSMRGRGHGHGYGYDSPYWGYSPYYRSPYYAAPAPAPAPAPALTDEQQANLIEQQKAIAKQQQQAFQRAVAAQREFAERLNREMMSPPELPADISKRIQEHEAKRDAMIRQRDSRFGAATHVAPRSEGMIRPGGESSLQQPPEMSKQGRDQQQHNPVMTQPDKQM